MTGWGQDGPLAATAGHDIDYIGVSGALAPIGRAGQSPVPPLNLVADFGGGGMLLAVGILAALLERERSGLGQVVDAAMVDGSALLTSFLYGMRAAGTLAGRAGDEPARRRRAVLRHLRERRRRYVAVGALEPKFYAALLAGLGLAGDDSLPGQHDRAGWPVLRAAARRRVPRPQPGRLGRGVRRHRRLRRARARPGRGARASAQRRARGASSRSAGWCSPPRRRVSGGRRPGCRSRRPVPARTPTRCSPGSAMPQRRSRNCGRAA